MDFDVEPATVELSAVAWEDKSDQLEFDALTRVRGAAEKWAASLAAILGLFGTLVLVRGPSDISTLQSPYRVIVGVVLGLALIAAAIAIYDAALAAQGTPREVAWPSGPELRQWERDQAVKAKSRLRRSRGLTFVAVGLVVLASALTWYAPTAGSTVLVIPAQGAAACGELTNGALGPAIETGAGVRVPLTAQSARRVVVVSACP
jgi:hypothetical protein